MYAQSTYTAVARLVSFALYSESSLAGAGVDEDLLAGGILV